MRAQELRKGDMFNPRPEAVEALQKVGYDPRLGGSYTVIGDAEILPWPVQAGGDPGPSRSRKGVRVLVQFPDGGTDARWFEIDQEVAHVRPEVAPGNDEWPATLARIAQEPYAVVEGHDLLQLIGKLQLAYGNRRAARFTVHDGLKFDVGEGWSASIGRPANETGH